MYEGLKRRFAFGLGKRDPYVRLIKRSSPFDDLLMDLWLGPGSGQSDNFRLTKRGLLELRQRPRDPYTFGLGK